MTMRLVDVGNGLPISRMCDPSVEFQAGMGASLAVIGNQVMATVSNGTSFIGVIDDMRTRSFTNNSWNEIIIAPATPIRGPNGAFVTPVNIHATLEHPTILRHSFNSDVDCILNPNNGVITFLAGTPLNYDMNGSGFPNAIRAVVNYTYFVANVPGEDSTAGSGRVTIWYHRFWFQTDQFETNQQYPLNANLYIGEHGMWTTRKPSDFHPVFGMCTAPPSPISPLIEILVL